MSNTPDSAGGGQQYGTNAALNGQNLDTSGMSWAVAQAAQAAYDHAKKLMGGG